MPRKNALSTSTPTKAALTSQFAFRFSATSICIWSIAVYLAWLDKSWGAVAIIVMGCPTLSVAMLLGGLGYAANFHKLHPIIRYRFLALIVVLVTLLGAATTIGAILRMDVHGC